MTFYFTIYKVLTLTFLSVFILTFIQVAIYIFSDLAFPQTEKLGLLMFFATLQIIYPTFLGPFLSDLARKEKVYPFN